MCTGAKDELSGKEDLEFESFDDRVDKFLRCVSEEGNVFNYSTTVVHRQTLQRKEFSIFG